MGHDELSELPGVGSYTAAATAAALGNESRPLVDSVSRRVFRRYFGGSPERSDQELAALAYQDAPAGHWHELNWAVLDLAALVCLPKRPRCDECPLADSCEWAKHRHPPLDP